MISRRETTQRRFSNVFYGHLWAFSLRARRDDAVFSVARLPVEISVTHDDETGFHVPHQSHARHAEGKIGAQLLYNSLELSPHA